MAARYDAIVVGAGPGGTTAARHLARAGCKTLLLEKEKMPRYKTCGGGVTAKVKTVLDVDFSPAVEDTIARGSIAFRDQVRFPVQFHAPVGWCVMRDCFDMLLANEAARAGAEVRDGTPVRTVEFEDRAVHVRVNGETFAADVVVGADGANGMVARAAGLHAERRLAAALEAEMELPDASLDTWRGVWHLDFGAAPRGYAWIFPKLEHLSVGVGTFGHGGNKPNLRELLDRFIASEPTLQGAKKATLHGHTLPLGGTPRRVSGKRVVLVGDAACLVDPFSGEGIYAAIKSGKLAAEALTRGLANGDITFESYTRRVQREFTNEYWYADALSRFFYRAPVRLLRLYQHTRLMHAFTELMASAQMDYRALVWKALARAPGYFIKRARSRLSN